MYMCILIIITDYAYIQVLNLFCVMSFICLIFPFWFYVDLNKLLVSTLFEQDSHHFIFFLLIVFPNITFTSTNDIYYPMILWSVVKPLTYDWSFKISIRQKSLLHTLENFSGYGNCLFTYSYIMDRNSKIKTKIHLKQLIDALMTSQAYRKILHMWWLVRRVSH